MRWLGFVFLQCLIIGGVIVITQKHQQHVVVLKEPPASLAQWYKPQNKRQVWLHTMFKLRREMLAVELYAHSQDQQHLQKWSKKLVTDYQKIGEMVPEWADKLNKAVISQIEDAVRKNNYQQVLKALPTLKQSCDTCHEDYRVVTATRYRAPDFAGLTLDDSTELTVLMQALSDQVNKIKIAFVDGRRADALLAYADLDKGMSQLGQVCTSCHDKETKPYPGDSMRVMQATLKQSLESGTLKEQGSALGSLAVAACANCHATHRLAFDARQLLRQERSWIELLRHSF